MDKKHVTLDLHFGFASSYVTSGTESLCTLSIFLCQVEAVTPQFTGSENQISESKEGLWLGTVAVITVSSSKAPSPAAARTTASILKNGKLCREGAKCAAEGKAGRNGAAGWWMA